MVWAKKFREISQDSEGNLREINERNIPTFRTKHSPPPTSQDVWCLTLRTYTPAHVEEGMVVTFVFVSIAAAYCGDTIPCRWEELAELAWVALSADPSGC